MEPIKECTYSNLKSMMNMINHLQENVGKWDESDLKKIIILEKISKRLVKEKRER